MTNSEIQTGTEYNSDVNDEDAEVYGYADDGEYAVVWAVWTEPDHYSYNVYNCEAGLCDAVYGDTVDRSEYVEAEQLARLLANDDPKGSVEAAREYWS